MRSVQRTEEEPGNVLSPTELTVTELLVPLAEIDDRGVYFEDSFASWRDHLRHGAAIAATLRERLDPAGRRTSACCWRTPRSSRRCWSRRGCPGIVPVGLNPVRRGAALARDIATPTANWCWPTRIRLRTLGDIEHINVDSAEWADEVAAHRDAELRFQSASPDGPVHADLHLGHQR